MFGVQLMVGNSEATPCIGKRILSNVLIHFASGCACAKRRLFSSKDEYSLKKIVES